MGPQARQEYLAQLRDRDLRSSRSENGRVLTEAVTVTGYHRKAIIRAWQRPAVRCLGAWLRVPGHTDVEPQIPEPR